MPDSKKELNRILIEKCADLNHNLNHPSAKRLMQQNKIVSTVWKVLASCLNKMLDLIGSKTRLSATSSEEVTQKTKKYIEEIKGLQNLNAQNSVPKK